MNAAKIVVLCSKTLTPTDRVIARRHFCFPRDLTRAAELPRSQDRSREAGGSHPRFLPHQRRCLLQGRHSRDLPRQRTERATSAAGESSEVASENWVMLTACFTRPASDQRKLSCAVPSGRHALCGRRNSVAPLSVEHSNVHRKQHWYSTPTARLTLITLPTAKQIPRNVKTKSANKMNQQQ